MDIRDDWSRGIWSLSATVEWITEQAGKCTEGCWNAAAEELLLALQTGRITSSGEMVEPRAGRRAVVPKEEFLLAAQYETYLPGDEPPGETRMLCWRAQSNAACDKDWRMFEGDTIEGRYRQIYWRRISVMADDVRALWPAKDPMDQYRTGAPGKPSPIQFVVAEAQRRRDSLETLDSIVAEARELHKWCKANHPSIATPSPGTIETRIRSEHNAWKNRHPHN